MKSVFNEFKTQNNMDVKLKYRAWVGEKHADISSPLTNSDIETFAIEFAEWLVKNCFIPDVMQRSEQLFAFLEYCDNAGWIKNVDKKRIIEDYEKANNCE